MQLLKRPVLWRTMAPSRLAHQKKFFSAKKTAEEEEADFRRIFEGKDVDYTFKTYEVYFLRKDLELMRRHIDAGIKLGACMAALSTGVYFILGWKALGLGMLAFSTIPVLRGIYMRFRTRNLVSSIWLHQNLKTVEIIYG